MKIVVIVENGSVQHVYSDDLAVRVAVLDRDVGGDESNRLGAVQGEPAALDSLRRGVVKLAPALVDRAFVDLRAALGRKPDPAVRWVRDSLFPAEGLLSESERRAIRAAFTGAELRTPSFVVVEGGPADSIELQTVEGGHLGRLTRLQAGSWQATTVEEPAGKHAGRRPAEVTVGQGGSAGTACEGLIAHLVMQRARRAFMAL